MFESIVTAKSARRGRASSLLAASIAVHIVVVGLLFVRNAWALEKLAVPHIEIVYAAPRSAPPPPPPPPGGERKTESTPEVHKKEVRNSVQPRIEVAEINPQKEAGSDGDDSGSEGGMEGGIHGGVENGIPGGVLDGIGTDLGGPAPEPQKRSVVSPQVLRGLRIAGEEQIRPPSAAVIEMERSGQRQFVAKAKLCLTETGRVESVSLLQPSGIGSWDQRILARMRGWRYQPYRVGAEAIPVCTKVSFVYKP